MTAGGTQSGKGGLIGRLTQGDRWIPLLYVGMFVVIIVVNGILVTYAFSTWRGLETEHHYEKGLHYNETLEQVKSQQELGWQGNMAFERMASTEGADSRRGTLTFTFLDKDGQPLSGAQVRLKLMHTLQDGHDQIIDMAYQGQGRYVAEAAFPLLGFWDVHGQARTRGHDFFFKEKVRIR